MTHRLIANDVTLRYQEHIVANGLSLTVPAGSFTAIIGPNACGKSTILRALSRLLRPNKGEIVLDGKNIYHLSGREMACSLGLLPQAAIAPEGITVIDLVARGRYPHQSFFKQWSKADEEAVNKAMAATHISQLSHRLVDELSGGQRQRVWIAMVLAQETPILLLDEPTTFLDIAHQIELMELLNTLNKQGKTIVAVLHDLNQACRYASNLIAIKNGAIIAKGKPAKIITEKLIADVFDLQAVIIADPVSNTPLIVPKAKIARV